MTERTVEEADQGFCPHCHTIQGVHSVPKEQEAGIAEDATSLADYYLMDEHVDPRTSESCKGVEKTAEALHRPEEFGFGDDDFDPTGDYEDFDPAVEDADPIQLDELIGNDY